jgi:hypothetical protein
MFKNCRIVCKEAERTQYHAQDARPGEAAFVMSAGALLEFARCPSRWITAAGEMRRPPSRWRALLESLHLLPKRFDERFIVRPDTYAALVNKCPACKSVTEAAICRKCGQRRRKEQVSKPWSANAEYCAMWQAAAEKKKLTVIKAEDRTAADQALQRLDTDPTIADFRAESDTMLWVTGEWQDVDTGLRLPLRSLIAYWPRANSTWGNALGGFKTPRDAGHAAWTRQCYAGGSHVSAALALDLYRNATDEDRDSFYYVLSEQGKPFEPGRRQLSHLFLNLGRKTYQSLLGQYAKCLKSKVWPAYDLAGPGPQAWSVVEIQP